MQVRMYAWAMIYGGVAVAHVARPPPIHVTDRSKGTAKLLEFGTSAVAGVARTRLYTTADCLRGSNSGFFRKAYSWSLFHDWMWAQGSAGFKSDVSLLLDRQPFWVYELALIPKDPERIQLAPYYGLYGDMHSPSTGYLCCICTPDDTNEVWCFQGSGAFILPTRSNVISFANWMPRRNKDKQIRKELGR